MTTKISQWQRIALLTAGISASMASVSWAGNPFGLYQLHSDGTVWQYLQQPCQGNVCNGWQQILNGSSGAVQLVGGGPGELFALLFQNNEWIDGYTGPPCTNGDTCNGWAGPLNSGAWGGIAFAGFGGTNGMAASGGGPFVILSFSLDCTGNPSGQGCPEAWGIFEYTGGVCGSSSCPLAQLDNNPLTGAIFAGPPSGGRSGIYQMHSDRTIWQYTGVPCTSPGYYAYCPGWEMLDNNGNSATMAVGSTGVYQMWSGGNIFQFNGNACTANGCGGWSCIC